MPEFAVMSVKVPSRLFLKRRLMGSCALWERAVEARAVDEEDVDPVVVVEVVEGYAAAGGFEQEAVLVLAAVDGFGVEAAGFRDVDEAEAERRSGDGG